MDKKQIDRINELAKKSREGSLTDVEKEEQQNLRQMYIQSIKKNFRATLDNIKVKDENGDN